MRVSSDLRTRSSISSSSGLGSAAVLGLGAVAAAVVLLSGGGTGGASCVNQLIPKDVRKGLSKAAATKAPAVKGTVYFGTCDGESWATARFPHNKDGVFKRTGFTWTRVGSIKAARCLVPSELLTAWKQGGC